MDDKRSCSTQFSLNNLSEDEREYLIKKSVREEVCKYADVDIAIRGRFISAKDNSLSTTDRSRQLHLHITGRTKQNLNMAVNKIESFLSLQEKITVGIDVFPSIFRMPSKILGENKENVDYIKKETGADIILRGKGSNNPENKEDPLHILVKYKDSASKGRTQQLILNLIETVQQDFLETYGKFYSEPKKPVIIPVKKPEIKSKKITPPKEPVKSTIIRDIPKDVSKEVPKNVPNDTTSHIEKITLGLSHIPLKFNLKSKIYGPNLSNVKHIEKMSSAVLLVEGVNTSTDGNKGNPAELPHILVKYLKPELKDKARSLILNLIETIHQEYESLYGTHLAKPITPEIIPVKTASKFLKPLPSESSIKQAEKKPTSTVRKYPPEDARPETRGVPEKSAANSGPVPPPPPVISKPLSPIELNRYTPSNPSTDTETNINPFQKSESLGSTYSAANRLISSFMPQNIKPIPSIVPPVAGISAQSHVPAPAYVQHTPSYVQPPEIPPRSSNDLEYFKKRSISPSDMGLESKKFCIQPTNLPPYESNNIPQFVEPIDSITISRGPSKVNTSNNRYLVELPQVVSTPVPTKTPAPTKPPSPVKTSVSSKDSWSPRTVSPWLTTSSRDQVASTSRNTALSSNGSRWESVPSQSLEPPKIAAIWEPATSTPRGQVGQSRSSTSWDSTTARIPARVAGGVGLQSSNSTSSRQPPSAKPQIELNLRGPYKNQYNGKPIADDDAVLSFLNECAKAVKAAKPSVDMFEGVSDDEDTKSIILIDSEEEMLEEEKRNRPEQSGTRTIAVQTDEELRRANVRCACGRFTRALNTVRSVGIQTLVFRYGQKL